MVLSVHSLSEIVNNYVNYLKVRMYQSDYFSTAVVTGASDGVTKSHDSMSMLLVESFLCFHYVLISS